MKEKVRVLVVDDSSFFRKRIRNELERTGEIQVAGEAENGHQAVEMAGKLRPDLITMDVAMPLMDGIEAVRQIMREHPTKIIMFSALTSEGARSTLEALEAGAVDFLPKAAGFGSDARHQGRDSLCRRVIDIAHRPRRSGPAVAREGDTVKPATPRPAPALRKHPPRLVTIGASTGGPVAIQRVLSALSPTFPLPVVTAVHMPAEFTATFAERLDSTCRIGVALATDAAKLRPGQVLIAPGGMQTTVEGRGEHLRLRIRPGGEELYKPSVDLLFSSAAEALGAEVLAVILTGMGADGTQGAGKLKRSGATVWSQDEGSSVVYGMPFSVVKAGYSDRVLPLDEVGEALMGLS